MKRKTVAGGNAGDIQTLPDYLALNLDIIFVGINPGFYSAQVGHYFAHPRNRFWAAFNAARLAPEPLGPDTDHDALRFGIGFTDVVKRPTHGMAELKPAEFKEGARLLHEKLLAYQPRIVCFNGLSGYKNYARYAGASTEQIGLGLQTATIGRSWVFVLPSPSPANAAVSLEQIVERMREMKALLGQPE